MHCCCMEHRSPLDRVETLSNALIPWLAGFASPLNVLGWLTTAAMFAASIAVRITFLM